MIRVDEKESREIAKIEASRSRGVHLEFLVTWKGSKRKVWVDFADLVPSHIDEVERFVENDEGSSVPPSESEIGGVGLPREGEIEKPPMPIKKRPKKINSQKPKASSIPVEEFKAPQQSKEVSERADSEHSETSRNVKSTTHGIREEQKSSIVQMTFLGKGQFDMLMFQVVFVDGKKLVISNQDLKIRAPGALLRFYEKHVHLNE